MQNKKLNILLKIAYNLNTLTKIVFLINKNLFMDFLTRSFMVQYKYVGMYIVHDVSTYTQVDPTYNGQFTR